MHCTRLLALGAERRGPDPGNPIRLTKYTGSSGNKTSGALRGVAAATTNRPRMYCEQGIHGARLAFPQEAELCGANIV